MLKFFETADMLGKGFWICAIAATLFFALRLVMLFAGFDAEDGGGLDTDVDGGLDGDVGGEGTDAAFEILSINSLTAFVMMFGWVGLTCYIQYNLPSFLSIAIAFVAGTGAMLFTAYLFKLAMKLVDRGSSFKIQSTVGMNASVYQQIPADGRGKVNVTIPGGLLRELEAISADKELIKSFTTVKVVEVIDSQTVSVGNI